MHDNTYYRERERENEKYIKYLRHLHIIITVAML